MGAHLLDVQAWYRFHPSCFEWDFEHIFHSVMMRLILQFTRTKNWVDVVLTDRHFMDYHQLVIKPIKALLFIILQSLFYPCVLEAQEVQNAKAAWTHVLDMKDIPILKVDDSKKPVNIIIMIADGMGFEQLTAAHIANKGRLYLDGFPVTGMLRCFDEHALVTDSAAAASAIATGKLGRYNQISINAKGEALPTIAQYAMKQGYPAGLVSSSEVVDATPAAFYAHHHNRHEYSVVANALVDAGFSVIIGGGRRRFSPEQLRALEHNTPMLAWIGNGNSAPAPQRSDSLMQSVKHALQHLQAEKKERDAAGFLLIFEAGRIDHAGHANKLPWLLDELLDFDRCVGEVLKWMKKNPEENNLLLILADHSTAGLVIHGGELKTGEVQASFSSTKHTGCLVPLLAAGPQSQQFSGIKHLCDLHGILMQYITPFTQDSKNQSLSKKH